MDRKKEGGIPFKKGRREENKGEMGKRKRKNQSVGAKFFPLNSFMAKK